MMSESSKGVKCVSKMFSHDFMVLNGKELSFEKKRPRRHLPSSAAEHGKVLGALLASESFV